MYTEILEALKVNMETSVNAAPIQVDYFGNVMDVDLRAAAVLIEPKRERTEPKDTRWRSGKFEIRIIIMVGMVRDYILHMKELEYLIGAEDQGETKITGVKSAILKLRTDWTFAALTGSMGGKAWRVRSGILEINDTTFGISMRGSEKVLTAQMDMAVYIEIER